MLSPLSKIQQVMHDTLFSRSEGLAFAKVCHLFGMDRPAVIRTESWRNACKAAIYSAKGTPGPIFRFLEHTFSEWTEQCSTFTGLTLSTNLIEFDEVTANMENRFCRIGGKLYRSGAALDGTQLTFVTADTTLFTAADFTSLQTVEVAFLPFDIVEHGCLYKVLLDDGILGFPPTYLREDGEVRGDEPLGGHILDFNSIQDALRFADPLDTGAFPAYLGDDDFTSAFGESFINMLVAGVRGQIIDFMWARAASSLYGSIYNRKVYGTVTPAAPDLVTPTRV